MRLVTHVDLDGVAAAAVVARWGRGRGVRVRVRGSGARGVRRSVLGELRAGAGEGAVVFVSDLSPGGRGEAGVIASGLRFGSRLVWVDHHVWAPGAVEELEAGGAVVVVDRSSVSAEIACRVVGCWGDGVSARLVEAARADDSCAGDPLAERWRLVLRVLGPRVVPEAVSALARGELWPGWAREAYERHAEEYYGEIRRETRVLSYSFDGLRVAVLVPPARASACDVERAVEPPGADLLVVLYPRGLSIRSLSGLRADCIAKRLGGGGHPGAAGAPRPAGMGPAQVARMVARAAEGC